MLSSLQKKRADFLCLYPIYLVACLKEKLSKKLKKNITEAIELYLEDADAELYHVTPKEAQREFMASVPVTINV